MLNKRLVIAAPGGVATGGPELSHQLARALLERGMDVSMFYYLIKGKNRVCPPEFEIYQVPTTTSLKGVDVMIVPEIRTDLLRRIKAKKLVIWWMSVDNYYKYYSQSQSIIKRLSLRNSFTLDDLLSKKLLHLCQSYYSRNHLTTLGIKNTMILKDFLGEEFLRPHNFVEKSNIVLYNPKKGKDYYEDFLSLVPDYIEMIPLQGFTRQEMIEIMLKSKVYLDLGEHPGMDRIPREAAMCGCVPICLERGSVANNYDVPIPKSLKLSVDFEYDKLFLTISDIFNNHKKYLNDLEEYISVIRNQKGDFEIQVDNFVRQCLK